MRSSRDTSSETDASTQVAQQAEQAGQKGEQTSLSKGLTGRHIQFMALGSAIGTGLFYGSADAIKAAGPIVLLAYIVAGAAVFIVMRSLGEMAVRNPVAGAFSDYATRYLGRYLGFTTGWTYVFCMLVVSIADVTAVSVYMGLWFPNAPRWIWAAAVVLLIAGINTRHVKVFGEMEFWMSIIKVGAVIAMILGGIAILIFGMSVPGEATPGLHNLFEHGGLAPNGWIGILACLTMVVFSFGGIETIAVTAGEADDPHTAIPRAVNSVPIRILLFYVLALGVIMTLVPWHHMSSETSPFVQIFATLGIPAAQHILNVVVLTAAISAINANSYGAGRMLFGMAHLGQSPRAFTRTTGNGVPWAAALLMMGALTVGVVLNFLMPESAFAVVASVGAFAITWLWCMVLLSHTAMRIKLRRAGVPKEELEFPVPLWPITPIFAGSFLLLVIGLMAWFPGTRVSLIAGAVWIALISAIYLVTTWVKKRQTQ